MYVTDSQFFFPFTQQTGMLDFSTLPKLKLNLSLKIAKEEKLILPSFNLQYKQSSPRFLIFCITPCHCWSQTSRKLYT